MFQNIDIHNQFSCVKQILIIHQNKGNKQRIKTVHPIFRKNEISFVIFSKSYMTLHEPNYKYLKI